MLSSTPPEQQLLGCAKVRGELAGMKSPGLCIAVVQRHQNLIGKGTGCVARRCVFDGQEGRDTLHSGHCLVVSWRWHRICFPMLGSGVKEWDGQRRVQ